MRVSWNAPALLAIVAVTVVHGQPAAADRFEVASVKPSNADPSSVSGIKTGHGRLDAHNVTLKRCIIGAYGIGPHQVFGGPDWLDADRFDILAKADRPVDDDAALMLMLRQLLADRFKLALRRETRTMPAFVLETLKSGPRMQRAEDGESGTNTASSEVRLFIHAHHTGMDGFARILARQTQAPVVNRTGLEGLFNFQLHWRREGVSGTDEPSLFTALQEQLGLRLRAEKTAVEVLVIESVTKPSEN